MTLTVGTPEAVPITLGPVIAKSSDLGVKKLGLASTPLLTGYPMSDKISPPLCLFTQV